MTPPRNPRASCTRPRAIGGSVDARAMELVLRERLGLTKAKAAELVAVAASSDALAVPHRPSPPPTDIERAQARRAARRLGLRTKD